MSPDLYITRIGIAIIIRELNDVNIMTNPFFQSTDTSFPIIQDVYLVVDDDPAFCLDQTSVIDACFSVTRIMSIFNDLGRRLLNARRGFTIINRAKNLATRPVIHGLNFGRR
jgi:hypothetical protein